MGRDEKIVIRINSAVKERIQKYADEMGISMSSLCAFIIGSYLRNQESVVQPLLKSMQDTFKDNIQTDIFNIKSFSEGIDEERP